MARKVPTREQQLNNLVHLNPRNVLLQDPDTGKCPPAQARRD